MLKKIALLRERVEDWSLYPFSVPTIASLPEIEINSRIVFFSGENGSGKSTLLEAIAAHYGFGPEGGNRNIHHDTTEHNHSTDALVRALRLSFDKRTGAGFFLRAESFFNTATHIDELDNEVYSIPVAPILPSYGGQSLHSRSHGETFFTLLERKFTRNRLLLLEPEASTNPKLCSLQLAFACSPSPPKDCHFDRSCSRPHREQRSGEICFSTTTIPSSSRGVPHSLP
jgi:predicted ATPase